MRRAETARLQALWAGPLRPSRPHFRTKLSSLCFSFCKNLKAPAAPGGGAQLCVRWLALEASEGPGCAEESQVSFEEQEVGQHR